MKFIVILIIAASIISYIYFSEESKFECSSNILNAYTRIGILKVIYKDSPDSMRYFRDTILEEEEIDDTTFSNFENYLLSNPQHLVEFLDSVQMRIDSLIAQPRIKLKKEIFPKNY
ncbi:MAG: hypothetical protein GY855_17440 [candidate division Zixibacteria bacterium]|nr:hypothetical protein [candidate division Zixibacteria bacterium]